MIACFVLFLFLLCFNNTRFCSLSLFLSVVPFLLPNKEQSSRSERSSTSSDTRTVNHCTGTRRTRTRTRRGISPVTTASIIADLKEKEEKSDKQAAFYEELLSMDAVLKKAKKKLEEGGALTIPFLTALIKSKGADPPGGRRKAPFETAWRKVKDNDDWKRTAFFTKREKMDLQVLEDDDSEDEE